MSDPSKHKKLEERDFTGGAIHALPHIFHGSTGDKELDAAVEKLVEAAKVEGNAELIEELVITALKIGRDKLPQGDLKLFNRSLKEFRAGSKVFHPYRAIRKVSVFGSARTQPDKPEYQAAVEFGEKMEKEGYMMITGAGDGIMGAAQKGAGRENGFGLNIRLPFEQGANETIQGDEKLINYNYFFTRKLSFVKEAHAIALFPGGFGTMDEGFEALTLMQTGKCSIYPMVMVDAKGGSYWKTWEQFVREHLLRLGLISENDFSLFVVTDDVDEAVEHILHFYKNFHSYRRVDDTLILRLQAELTDESVQRINDDFSDMLVEGQFSKSVALEAEGNETEIADLPRIVGKAIQGNYARLRELIDVINDSYTV